MREAWHRKPKAHVGAIDIPGSLVTLACFGKGKLLERRPFLDSGRSAEGWT